MGSLWLGQRFLPHVLAVFPQNRLLQVEIIPAGQKMGGTLGRNFPLDYPQG